MLGAGAEKQSAHGRAPQGTISETIRQPRDRLKGSRRSVSIAPPTGGTRDRLPPARGAIILREGSSPNGRDANPGYGSSAAARLSEASRARPEGRARASDMNE